MVGKLPNYIPLWVYIPNLIWCLTIMTIILLGLAVKIVKTCLVYVLPTQDWFNLIKITKGLNLHGSVISKLWASGK